MSYLYFFFLFVNCLQTLFDAPLSQKIHAHPLYFTSACAQKRHPPTNFDFVPVEKGFEFNLTVFKYLLPDTWFVV